MSGQNWDKIIKGGTKSKHAPPKAKYIDPLVQGTFEGEYAVADIAQAIAPRLRDSNSTVVFKALIVVHMLLRSGNIKYTYGVWSSKPHLLGLNSVTSGHDSVQNLTKYAYYLHTRLKTYASLGRDCIRDRGERRAEGRGDGGERLRGLTVEKGLLREVATLQKLMDTLLECRFYLEDKEDEVTMTALRLLVKDLLILFTSVNEGVINVLEHYFEMAQVDATTALKIYKAFCKQTEKVVAYLGVAKKMQNVLNVPVPNLKHAPVSLAGSLEEYLKDPNFEQNRIEYKRNREIAEGKPVKPTESRSASSGKNSPAANGSRSNEPKQSSSASTSAAAKPSADGNKAFVDFFEAIEQEQTNMFDPNTGSPNAAYFQQQAAFNPFSQQPNMLPIGQMSLSSSMPFGSLQPQMTGAMAFGQLQPQMTGAFGMNAFGQPQQQQQQPQMMQPQPTGFLQPQATGFNPFRQSMMMPQMTGMNPFGQQQQPQQSVPPFGQSPQRPFSAQAFGSPQNGQQQGQQQQGQSSGLPQLQPQWTGMNAFQRPSSAPIGQQQQAASTASNNTGTPQRLGSIAEQNPSSTQTSAQQHPLAPQKTGSKNPFAPPPGSMPASPPKPPQPSMNQIALQAFQNAQQEQQQQQQQQQPQQPQQNGSAFGNGFGGNNNVAPAASNTGNGFGDFFNSNNQSQQQQQQQGALNQSQAAKPQVPVQTGLMGSIASDFAFGRAVSPSNNNNSNNNNANISNGNGQNGANNTGMPFNTGGNLPSFTSTGGGSSQITSPSVGSTTTGISGSGSTPSFNFSSNTSNISNSNTGASSSMFGSAFGGGGGGGPSQNQQQQQPLQSQATGFGGSAIKPFQPSSSFGASLYAEQAKRQGSGSDAQPQQQLNQQQGGFGSSSSSSAFGGAAQQQSTSQFGNNFDLLGGGGGGGGSTLNNAFGNAGGGGGGGGSTLQPQATGTPNPFRMSMMPGNSSNNNAQSQFGGSGFAGGSGTPQQQGGGGPSNGTQSQWGSLI